MKLNTNFFGLLLTIFALSACGSLRNGGAPEPSFNFDADLESISKEFESATNISNFYKTPQAQRSDARNRFVSGRLVQIDLQYLKFIRTLTSEKQQLDAATDVANMTLNLAGTLVSGVRAKSNLAATAAGIGGTKTTIDKDFYYEKSIQALVATMNAQRKEMLVRILQSLAKSLDDYPFERSLTDLNEYYLAGTLNGAIQFINVQAAQSEAKSTQRIFELSVPTKEQIVQTGQLTDAIGAENLTLDKAKNALKSLGATNAELPTTLNDAKQLLKNKVREAERLTDGAERATALKRIADAFKAVGMTQ